MIFDVKEQKLKIQNAEIDTITLGNMAYHPKLDTMHLLLTIGAFCFYSGAIVIIIVVIIIKYCNIPN